MEQEIISLELITYIFSLMWRIDEFEYLSPELMFVYQSSLAAVVVGSFYGAYIESAKSIRNFLERNKYEMFKHPKEAQGALQDRIFLSSLKVGRQ